MVTSSRALQSERAVFVLQQYENLLLLPAQGVAIDNTAVILVSFAHKFIAELLLTPCRWDERKARVLRRNALRQLRRSLVGTELRLRYDSVAVVGDLTLRLKTADLAAVHGHSHLY